MTQKEPEKTSVKEILKLVEQLSPENHEQLVEDMKLQWLRREVQKGIEHADRGELVDGVVVFAELKKRYQNKSDQK